MSNKAVLKIDGKEIELPMVTGTEKEQAVDIAALRKETGFITLDNGYVNTGSCRSAITYLDGEKGILRYRGYSIEELAEKSSFTEVAKILWDGEKPDQQTLSNFQEKLRSHYALPDGFEKFLQAIPPQGHPMGALASSLSALATFFPQYLKQDLSSSEKEEIFALMMGLVPVIAASYHAHSLNRPFPKSDTNRTLISNFLHLMFPGEKSSEDSDVQGALDVLLILHADHEQNCSTSTVRLVGSSKANIFASLSSGVQALWGPLHGGANQAVLEMLESIQKDGGDYKKFLTKAKDKSDSFRLMGFGHRVYKNFDPRAKIIKKSCDTILNKLGVNDPLLDIAKGLEEEALKDSYFIERKLYPNVDFYSGIIYRALGIPTNMFTVMFALGRLPGWLSQWKELVESDSMKIGRPRQIYTGEGKRSY